MTDEGCPRRSPVIDEPTDCQLVQLKDLHGQFCSLTLVTTPQGTRHLLVQQIRTALLLDTFSAGAVRRHLSTALGRGRLAFKRASSSLKAKLVRFGACSASAFPLLTTVHACLKARHSLGYSRPMLDSLTALQGGTAVTLHLQGQQLFNQNAPGNPNPSALTFSHLPTSISLNTGPVLGKREKYSLHLIKPSLAQRSVLSMQLQGLKTFSQTPIIVGRRQGAVKSVTWDDIVKHVMLFLGYAHRHLHVAQPNLEHFARADFLAAYFSSKASRGDRGRSLAQVVYVALRVCDYWKASVPQDVPRLQQVEKWLEALPSQFIKQWPSKKRGVGSVLSDGRLENVVNLLLVLVHRKAAVESAFAHVSTELTVVQARLLHDVALACIMFGWLPPVRGSCVRTLCPPMHKGPCEDPDCVSQDCLGNQLGLVHGNRLQLYLPHHKSEKTWGVIHFVLPGDLTSLLLLYLEKGYRVLKRELEAQHPFAFMTRAGHAFDTSAFSSYFKQLMCSWGGPAVSPHNLRHLYVSQRRQETHSTPAADRGAAYVMGHDHAQWHATYDVLALQRSGQQAVDAMAAWRTAMLAGHTLPPAAHPAPSVAPSTSALLDDIELDGGIMGSDVSETSESSLEDDLAMIFTDDDE